MSSVIEMEFDMWNKKDKVKCDEFGNPKNRGTICTGFFRKDRKGVFRINNSSFGTELVNKTPQQLYIWAQERKKEVIFYRNCPHKGIRINCSGGVFWYY